MLKSKLTLFILLVAYTLQAQEVGLPLDLRQHNLTENNSSILNPANSVNYEYPHSVALWTRWQWQMVDGDPTTLFVNYTGKINSSSSVGAGFFQHNTGIFLNTGGVLNYAYSYNLSDRARLSFGLNAFAFLTQLADDRFQIDPQIQLPLQGNSEDFIIQFAPGIQFTYDQLSVGLTSENLFGYNATTKESSPFSEDKIFLGTAAYDFPVNIIKSESGSIIRPMLYVKTVPGYDTQVGLNTMLMTNRFWAQTGFNSFYGLSIGGGGRLFNRLSIGAVVELGAKPELKGKDPTFELVTSFDFGKIDPKSRIKPLEEPEEEPLEEIADVEKVVEELTKAEELAIKKEAKNFEREQRKKTKDSLDLIKSEEAVVANMQRIKKRRTDSLERAQKSELVIARNISRQRRLDSIAEVKSMRKIAETQKKQEQIKQDSIRRAGEAEALVVAQRKEQQRKTDSINEAKLAAETAVKEKARIEELAEQTQEVKPQAGEKYKEVVGEDGLTPGYYLIANVFGTKKYLDAFIANLTKKGLQPKSFFRSKDKYNYVYLERYETIDEARRARDSKFNGRYADKTSIYSVKAKDSLALVKKEAAVATNLRKEQERRTDSINKVKQQDALVLERISKQRQLDSLATIDKEKALAEADKRKNQIKLDSIKTAKEVEALAEAKQKELQRKSDSISEAKIATEIAVKEKVRLEQIAQQAEEDKPQAGEKYEEVVGEDGLAPGYYLIANVFGTKKYFDAFMSNLNKKGLQPISFFRSKNKYNYVYLKRYDTLDEARRARDSKFNGRYADETSIYRVKPN